MRRARLLGAAALALGLAACQSISDVWDRAFGSKDASRGAELVEFEPRAAMRVLWQGSAGEAQRNVFFPALDGKTVFAAGAAGRVAGFDVASGEAVIGFEAGQPVSGGVGAGSGLVLLGTPTGKVLAFSREGKPLWTAQVPGEVLAPPAVSEGIVVVRAGGGRIYGFDAATGKQRWVYERTTPPLSVRSHAGVAIERGAVFAGFPGGRLVGLELGNGRVGWEAVVTLPRGTTELERVADVASVPVIDGARVCAVAYQGRLACYDVTRGTLVWARNVSSLAGFTMDSRNLYLTDDRDAVVALDKSRGASLWRQDKLAGRGVTAPLAIRRYVAVGDREGYVHLLSAEDGSFAARLATDGSAIGAPPLAIGPSTFVVQTRNGGVFAISVE